MFGSDEGIGINFKRALISVSGEEDREYKEFNLPSDFYELKSQLTNETKKNLKAYILRFQASEKGKGEIQNISNQMEYDKYINTVKMYDYNTIHIFLEPLSNEIFDACFASEDLNESYEMGINEEKKEQSISRKQKQIEYDATESITEQNEISIQPSLQLSYLQSKQKSAECDLTGTIGIQNPNNQKCVSNQNSSLNTNKNQMQTQYSISNQEQIQNMINYEIVRQILSKFPKLQLENCEVDPVMKAHFAYYHSQNTNNRRSTSPQLKPSKKGNDLSQSMIMKNYKCNNCMKIIENVRFHCLVCQDTDHCETCQKEKRKEHNHPFLKYKNIQSRLLTKSQKLYPPNVQTDSIKSGNPLFPYPNANANLGFPVKTATSTYGLNPSNNNQPKNNFLSITGNSINGSNQNTPISQGTSPFSSQKQSYLIQTMPSVMRQQGLQQNSFQLAHQGLLFNNLQNSQNLNIPIQGAPLNQLQSDIQKSAINKFKSIANQVIHQAQHTPTNLFQNIKVQNLSSLLSVKVPKGELFKVAFRVKNGGEQQFPLGGVLRNVDSTWPEAIKPLQPLNPNSEQMIEFELRAPDMASYEKYHCFKVEFPNFTDKGTYEQRGPKFDFCLLTF